MKCSGSLLCPKWTRNLPRGCSPALHRWKVATFPQTLRTNRILFNSYLRQTGSDVNKVKCKQFTMFFVLYQFQHVPVVPGIWYIVPVVLLHKFCENDIFLEIKIHFLKTQVFLSQLRHDTNFCDIELYTCEGLQKDSPILAHRQVLFVCLV